jgi:hypothetical protein
METVGKHPFTCNPWSGISSFFIRWMDKKDKEHSLPELKILFDESDPDYVKKLKYNSAIQSTRPFHRKYFRIGIKNNGGTVAENCDGKIRILNNDKKMPQIQLPWESGQLHQDIGVGNTEFLNIMYCNSELILKVRKWVYLSTPRNLDGNNIYNPNVEDGFDQGIFEFEVIVREEKSGKIAKGKFQLQVKDYENTSMKEFSD